MSRISQSDVTIFPKSKNIEIYWDADDYCAKFRYNSGFI